MVKKAYINGFLAKCAESGLSEDDVSRILSAISLTQGATPEEDTDENDYKSGIGDLIRGAYKPNRIMARKQRRFERDFADKHGLSKWFAEFKHPYRAARAKGVSGASTMAISTLLATAIMAGANKAHT